MKLLAIGGIIVLVAGIGVFFYNRSRRIPDRFEPLGPFELVIHTLRYTSGWNEGKIYHGTSENYGLRYQGQPFGFDGKSGMFGDSTVHYDTFNSLITFPGRAPVAVVNVGDPNNSSFYYLIREKNGAAVAEFLSEGRGGVSAQWLDPDPGDTTKITDVALHRGAMTGGRLLLLGQTSVLDVETLTHYPVTHHKGAFPNQFKPPIALSPDRTSFARYGSGDSPDNLPLFVVFDFVGDTSYVLMIDRALMRYNSWEEMDRAWFEHHFEWKQVAGQHDRLVQRENIVPLPYKGDLRVDPNNPSYVEYNLVQVKPEMNDVIIQFIEREFQATRPPPEQYASSVSLVIGPDTVHVLIHEDQVGVFNTRGENPQPVHDIAARFDEELKTGKYDHLFVP